MPHPNPAIVNDFFAPRLALLYAAFFLTAGWQLPLFPVWLAARGLEPAAIGLALAALQLVRIVAMPAGTRLADRHGSLRGSIAAAALATIGAMTLTASVTGSAAIFAAVILVGLVSAPVMPLTDAYALQGLNVRGGNYGRVRLWGSVAFIVANLTGGFLLDIMAHPNLIWLIVAGDCAIAAAALMLVPLARSEAPAQGVAGHSHLRRPAFLAVAAAGSLIQASHAVYYGFSTLDWSAKGIDGTTIGALWALGVAVEIVLFAFADRLSAFSPAALIAIGAAGAILRWGGMALDPPGALLIPLQMLHAISFGATHLGTMMYLGQNAPEGGRAAAQGDIATANTLTMAAAAAAAGLLYGAGAALAYATMAALAAAGAAFALLAWRLR
jgi:PPP family 3-phenylpropionic acid transporter